MDKILSDLKKYYPIKIKNKSDSVVMKIISWMLFLINPKFMTHYITTIGNTIYLPTTTKEWPEEAIISTIVHEFVHINDSYRDKLFTLKYLFPQVLAPLFLIMLPFCWWLALILFVICLGPWPAPWRKEYELRAYKMSLVGFNAYFDGLASDEWVAKTLNDLVEIYNMAFTGPAYWFMWAWGVKAELKQAVHDIRTDDIFREDGIYAIGYDAIKNLNNHLD